MNREAPAAAPAGRVLGVLRGAGRAECLGGHDRVVLPVTSVARQPPTRVMVAGPFAAVTLVHASSRRNASG